MRLWQIAALCLALSAPVLAQELSAEARAAMTERVQTFKNTFDAGDIGALFDYMPPKILAEMAREMAVDEATFIEQIKVKMEQVMSMVKVNSFVMDLDAATYQMTPDGSMGYVLIPTEMLMTIEGAGKMKSTSQIVAFEDDGEWYLVGMDQVGQVPRLQAAYPAFAGVTFKPGTMEMVAD